VEGGAVHGAVQDHGGGHTGQAQGADESGGFPVAVRQPHAQPFPARRAPVQAAHLRGRPGFIDEHQPLGIEIDLAVEPGLSPLQDVRAVLLVRMGRLF
jgi:hypothetical protein